MENILRGFFSLRDQYNLDYITVNQSAMNYEGSSALLTVSLGKGDRKISVPFNYKPKAENLDEDIKLFSSELETIIQNSILTSEGEY